MKNIIPCKLTTYSIENNTNLMKVKLYIMKNGQNYNNSSFDIEGMKDAEESIKNTPILAFLTKDEDGNVVDFDGHNMETKLVEGEDGYELKTTFLEQPIGLIPESCNPRYEEINGKSYFVVDGYIWKSYSNGSYKLIEDDEFKSVSMEIKVDNGVYNENNGVYEIKKYRYEAVTVLGNDVLPAIDGCKIMKYSSSRNENKEILESIYKEIYKIESEVHEVEVVEEVVETIEVTEPQASPEPVFEVVEEVIENIEATEPVIAEEFKAKKEDEEEVNPDEEKVDEEEVEPDEEEKKKKPLKEKFSLECFNVFFEEVPESLDEVCSALVEKFNILNEELSALKEFKQNYDNAVLVQEVQEIISEFSFDEEEIAELKERAISGEMATKEFKKELFALEGMKLHSEKKKFSTEKEEKPSVKINVVSEIVSNEPYGGLFSKYMK